MIPFDFKKLLSARFFYSFAVQMQAVVVGWRMYDLTHDPLALGMIGLAAAVPALSLSLYGGLVVDRSHPLIVYRGVLLTSLLSGFVVLSPQIFVQAFDVHAQVIALYGASFITGLARAFSQPAIFAITPRIIARENLAIASAWSGSTLQVSRVAGPAFGGIIFGWCGMTVSAIAICTVLIAAVVALSLIDFNKYRPEKIPREKRAVSSELFAGTSFVFRHPILLPALSLDMISVLFGGVTALLPIFAQEVLVCGPKGLGILRAAPAVGATLMSFVMTRWNIKAHAGRCLLSSVAGFGFSILVFGVSHNFWLSAFALGTSGVFDSISMIVRSVAVQLASPENMRGQISAVNSIFIGSSNEIGEFESGVAAKILGTVPSVIFGGVICLATVATVTAISKPLREMNLEKL